MDFIYLNSIVVLFTIFTVLLSVQRMESTALKLGDHNLDVKDNYRPQLRSSSKLSVSGSDMSGFAPQLDVSPVVLVCPSCDLSVVKARRSSKTL